MYFFVPICVQCILLVRIVAVYPPRTLTWTGWLLVYGTLIVLVAARLVNMSLAFNEIVGGARRSASALVVGEIAWKSPYAKAEWFLQLSYDTYVSCYSRDQFSRGAWL